MAIPLRCTLPALGVSSPARSPRSVDLPLPDAPMIAMNSPLETVKSRPLRISTVRAPLRIDFCSPSTTIIGCGLPGFSFTSWESPSAWAERPQQFLYLIRWNDAESLLSPDSNEFGAGGIGMSRKQSAGCDFRVTPAARCIEHGHTGLGKRCSIRAGEERRAWQ